MKRVLSLVLALVMVFGTIMPAFADDAATTAADSQAGQDLKSYGVIAGTDLGLEEASVLTREQMTVILSQLYGKKTEAEAYAFAPSFTDVEEGKWFTPYVAFAEQQGWMSGDAAGGTFRPEDVMKAQEVNAMFVKALGYTVEWADVNTKAEELEIEITAADSTSVLRGEAFAALRTVLDTPKMDETDTLGTALALTNYVSPTPAAPEAVAVDSAKALNSNVIEVALDDADDLAAPTAVTVDQFSVVDEDDAVLEVEKVEFAPWDADNYTVLVTVADDMAAGSLYTVASGDLTVDFGGMSADETDPGIDSVESDDYNEVKITLTEAVLLDDVTVTITEKYGDKDELAVVNIEYSASDAILVTTDEQTDATLYEVEVAGLVDLAGNAADDATDTFTGQSMDTSEQTVDSANAVDSVTVDVVFDVNVNVEEATDASNYTITEKYGDKDEVAVASVEMKLDSDDEVIKTTVRLTLAADTTDATLYELEVANVGTLYGEALDSDDDSTTFTGKGADTDEPSGFSATADNNTTVVLTITDDSELADEYDVALFSIIEKYGDKDELAVISIDDVDAEAKTITLITDEQTAATLYEVTIAEGLADKFGNVTDEDLDATFTGEGVADEITSVTAVNTADKKVRVTFNENHGDNALSVASYSIDGGIGYPSAVKKIDADTVELTVSELKVGKVYEITVNNVYNADGVAMDKDGETDKFSGKYGDSDSDITLEAVVATDDRTLKLYFDGDVADLEGITLGADLTNTVFDLVYEGDTANVTTFEGYAYAHPTNDQILIVTADTAEIFENPTGDEITLVVNKTVVTNIENEDDVNEVAFAENASNADEINIDGVVALSSKTVKVYFDQAVRAIEIDRDSSTDDAMEANEFAFIDLNADGDFDATDIEFTDAYSINDSDTEWVFVLETGMDADMNNKLDFVVETGTTAGISTHELSNSKVAFDLDPTSNGIIEFSKNTTDTNYMTDIGVTMLDSKTVKVFFPEDMNVSDVIDPANYDIEENTDATEDDAFEDAITQAVWDTTDNSVILTIDTAFDTDLTKLQLKIAKTVSNKAGNKDVKDSDGDAFFTEFSVSTAAADDIAVQKVAATMNDGAPATIVITLDQALAAATYNGDTAAFLADFDVTVAGETLLATDITSVTTAAATDDTDTTDANAHVVNAWSTITLVLVDVFVGADDVEMSDNDAVEVTIDDNGDATKPAGLLNAEGLDDGSAGVTVVTDEETDTDVPTLTSADFTNATTLVVVFNEAVNVTAADFTDGKFVDKNNGDAAETFTVVSLTGSGTDTITITVAGSVAIEATDPGTMDIAAVKDLNGNAFVPVADTAIGTF